MRTLAAKRATARPEMPLEAPAATETSGAEVLEVPDGRGAVVAEERTELVTAGAEL